jgi:hypothetical protein
MMSDDPNSPSKLVSASNEIEAAAIVNALLVYEIEAFMTGGYTSGFKAEAPGCVDVLVRQSDLDRAIKALAEIEKQYGDE